MNLKVYLVAGAALSLVMTDVASAQASESAEYQSMEMQPMTASRIQGKTHVERALGKCVGSILGGALLGALVGKLAGDTGTGAAIGAGAGTVACAIMLKVASNKDKAEIRNAQLVALNTNQVFRTSWVTADNETATASVVPTGTGSVVVADKGSIACRSDDFCKVGDSWYPKADILSGAIDPNSPRTVKVAIQGARSIKCRRTSTSVQVADQSLPDGSDVACLIGDVWVTGDELKNRKIREGDIAI